MYIKRHMESKVLELSEQFPIVMVYGQRQVGKSTMLHHIMDKNRKYVTLDNISARRLAEEDPELFFETYGSPLLIDEFQRVPSILLEMKRIVDEKKLAGEKCEGMFWLTGSQKFKMMNNVSETLAGRVGILELAGLSDNEINGKESRLFNPQVEKLKKIKYTKSNIHTIYEKIFRGSMPRIVTKEVGRDAYYEEYINTYLERDIHELSNVGKLSEFRNFLVFMAARTGQELRYSEISKSIGVSAVTAKEWVSILERSGVIYILRPYFSNITKRLVKTPKVYFMDTGLASYLCRWPNAEVLESSNMDGAFFETYVVTEIVKSYYNLGINPNLYYYRDVDGKEIDLMVVEADKIYPIEIKKAKNPENATKNFKMVEKLDKQTEPGLVVCACDELVPYNRDAWYCPVELI